VEAIAKNFRTRQHPRFFGLLPEQAALIAQFYPEAAQQTLREAILILQHKFDLLGSGRRELGPTIDWHTDFISGYQWPLKHHTRLEVTTEGGADVKVPWELSRFHHGVRLGQAYLYTLDERYAQEALRQVHSWIKANPYEFGINWCGPMDVAIRTVNWVWTLYALFESESLTDSLLSLWLTSLRQHGEYLAKHLEDEWPRTHHLIADLTGLAYLGIMFPEFSGASEWRETGLNRLWEELDRQINPDGFNYEASVGYHRLVTEMVLHVMALCIINYIEIPETALARIKAMLDVVMLYTQPDGTSPQVGDFDNGRLLPLGVVGDTLRQHHDHRYLLGLGSIVLEREMAEWAGYVDPTQTGWSVAAETEWQDAFWLFASDTSARYTDVLTLTTPQPDDVLPDDWIDVTQGIRVRARALARRTINLNDLVSSRGLEATGLYIMRNASFHMTVDAGGVGMDGAGGHAHNDVFSVTMQAYGQTFIVDPGSYAYTAKPEERNAFRSTAYHNTLQIGQEEINPIPTEELFQLPQEAHITIHRWVSNKEYDLLDASHNGYARLEPAVVHRRQILFDKRNRLWILRDRLEHPDGHTPTDDIPVAIRFHLMPLNARVDRGDVTHANSETGQRLMILPFGDFPLQASIEAGWFAPRYGIKWEVPVVTYSGHMRIGQQATLMFYPRKDATNIEAGTVRSIGLDALQAMEKALSPSSGRFM
jgi:hypothetical protein